MPRRSWCKRVRIVGNNRRRTHPWHSLARLLSQTSRCSQAFRCTQGDCAGRPLAHSRRAHGVAQSWSGDFQLFSLDERSEELEQVDFRNIGNFESRLVRAFSRAAAIECCRSGIDRLMDLLPEGARERAELLASSPTHVGFLLHGLEFARVRHGVSSQSFARENEITFGAGTNETPLTVENEQLARDLFA